MFWCHPRFDSLLFLLDDFVVAQDAGWRDPGPDPWKFREHRRWALCRQFGTDCHRVDLGSMSLRLSCCAFDVHYPLRFLSQVWCLARSQRLWKARSPAIQNRKRQGRPDQGPERQDHPSRRQAAARALPRFQRREALVRAGRRQVAFWVIASSFDEPQVIGRDQPREIREHAAVAFWIWNACRQP